MMNDSGDSGSVHTVKTSTKHRNIGEFISRKSLLTDLFQISHINCIRNAFIVGFILMFSRQMINDLLQYGKLNWTFELFLSAVDKLHIAFIVWSLMILSTSIIVFYSTYTWAKNRRSAGIYLRFYDIIWLWVYVFYLASFLVISCWLTTKNQLPFVSSSIILTEQLRLLMKTHSFVRENVKRVLQQSNHSTDQSLSFEFSRFNQYIYFLWAPTLLYRDQYPRTSIIQWDIAWKMFGQTLIVLALFYYVIANLWMPPFMRFFTNDYLTLEFMIMTIFDLMVPGTLIVVLAFYGFFHCWFNVCAEVLRFADRMFYEDWWNSTSATTFWRSWNTVVHDWLYVYIYKDLNKVFHGNRKLSATCVVILSAIFHEYFMTHTLGFFYPILFVWFALFGILFRFVFPRTKGMQWNIIVLIFIPISGGLVPFLYTFEALARHSPLKRKTFWNMMFNSDQQSHTEL